MSLPLHLQPISLSGKQLYIYIPDADAVQKAYCDNKDAAYWAQVWPASIGLCNFLQQNLQHIENKNVLELAAGLGLSGLYAAGFARQVSITDREAQAIECIKQSAAHLQLQNVKAFALDWKDAPNISQPDIVLLSDVNYEPEVFEELHKVIVYFLEKNIPVIISTPQRLVAKPFINSLLLYCRQQWNSEVIWNSGEAAVSVFVLMGN